MNYRVTLLIICFLLCKKTSGEEKIIAFSGIGFPELLNVGARYQYEKIQVGACFGFPVYLDDYHKKMNSISVFTYSHFAGFSELTETKTWYFKTGLTYLWGETSKPYENVFLDIKIGREFNLTNKFGLGIGAGTALQVYERPKSDIKIFTEPFFPSLVLEIYYRF